ncbi:MAG TPA: metallopeptidase family protein [Candidatus Saccharimonadales bacterium]|nr:metallopeptidase family protein [Candidatus Saccharimonadales bacterium]
MQISDKEFEELLAEAIDKIPKPYIDHIQNVAFILEDEPTPEQRLKMRLRPDQTLWGLYEGIPLPARGGAEKTIPDKITIFKWPLLLASGDKEELRYNIGHTVWHETAHYFGLDHRKIDELDSKRDNTHQG